MGTIFHCTRSDRARGSHRHPPPPNPSLPLLLPWTSSTPKLEWVSPCHCVCLLRHIPEVLWKSAGYVFWRAESPAVLLTHWAARSAACCSSSPPFCISKPLLRQTHTSSRCSSRGLRRRRSGVMRVLCCFVNKSMLSATSDCHERMGIGGRDCLSH